MLFTFTEYKFVCCPEEPRHPVGWNCHVVPLWGYISWASRPTTAEQTLWSSVQLQTMQGLLEERREATSGIWPSGSWEWDGLRGVRSLWWTQCQDEPSDQQGPEVKSGVPACHCQTADNAGCAAPANCFSALPQRSTVLLAQIISCYNTFAIAM